MFRFIIGAIRSILQVATALHIASLLLIILINLEHYQALLLMKTMLPSPSSTTSTTNNVTTSDQLIMLSIWREIPHRTLLHPQQQQHLPQLSQAPQNQRMPTGTQMEILMILHD